jgi:hypothetical protein
MWVWEWVDICFNSIMLLSAFTLGSAKQLKKSLVLIKNVFMLSVPPRFFMRMEKRTEMTSPLTPGTDGHLVAMV